MLETILCVSDEEPASFHPENTRGFSVRLSYRLDEPAPDPRAARAAHAAFLAALEHVKFAAYTVNGAVVTPLAAPTMHAAPFEAAYRDRFIAWLDGRAATHDSKLVLPPAPHAQFFAAPMDAPGGPQGAATLRAQHVVLSAASWTAPVPQHLHLSFVLQVTGAAATDRLVFVPWLSDAPADTAPVINADPGPSGTIRWQAFSSAAHRYCESNVTKLPDLDAAAGSSLIDGATGFAQAGAGSERDQRLLARFEQRAGSQLSGFVAVRELAGAVRWDDGSSQASARLLAWSAVSALAGALDTILIALLMPGRTVRDGPLLAPFLNLLLARLGELGPTGLDPAAPRRQVRSLLREALAAPFAASTDTVEARTALVRLLLGACNMTAQEDDPNAPPQPAAWLRVLLNAYVLQSDAGFARVEAAVLAHRAGYTGPDPARAPAQLLDQQLAPLQDRVMSETGVEDTVARLLSDRAVATHLAEALALPDGGANTARGLVVAAYDEALAAFRKNLHAGLNGAEAARQAAGSLLADLLLLEEQDDRAGRATERQLRQAFDRWAFWQRRLGVLPRPSQASLMDEVVRHLARPVPDPFVFLASNEQVEQLAGVAIRMQESASAELLPSDNARFLPDHAPQGLGVRLTIDPAADDQGGEVDDFAATFSGVALLVRSRGSFAPDAAWAYANLAQVELAGVASPAPLLALSIQPIPTTVVDGRRSVFVSYDGLPIATSAFDDTLAAPTRLEWEKLITTDYPDKHPGYKSLAPLAYGTCVEIAAHAVGRAGTLPRPLQEDGRLPWLPERDIHFDEERDGKHYVTSYACSRRTAIGRTTIAVHAAPGSIKLEGVKPLATDYPRLGLSSHAGQFLDVFRNSDGSGAIGLPTVQNKNVSVILRELWLWKEDSSRASMSVAVLSAQNSTGSGVSHFSLDHLDTAGSSALTIGIAWTGSPGKYTLTLPGTGQAPVELALAESDSSAWLRLQLQADQGKPAAIGLADPAADTPGSATASQPVPDNLILLGAKETEHGARWHQQFPHRTDASLDFPRVGYLDFARWVANPALADQLLGTEASSAQRAPFLALLLAAYMSRTDEPQLARLLERLPDPAVSSLRIELVATDGLIDAPGALRRNSALLPETVPVPMPSLKDFLATGKVPAWIAQGEITKILMALDKALTHGLRLEVRKGNLYLNSTATETTAFVPPGLVARLSARPVVRPALFADQPGGFPGVIDRRLLEWAVGVDTLGGDVCFEGASVQIETMIGPLQQAEKHEYWQMTRGDWTALAREMVGHKASGTAREYRLLTAAGATSGQWRQVGAVEVSTQRWRFSGRPIYTWFDPKSKAFEPSAPGQASIRLDCAVADAVFSAFEQQAFFGRMPYDAEVRSTPLLPLPAATELVNVSWDEASATLFRHRFTLRSRYAAAMLRPADGACDAWSEKDADSDLAWLRVAMLADRSHLTLTRPQLRALIPATCSPDQDSLATPPLIGMLQEHPFCNGGLAARIAAEVRTGIGFELADGRHAVVQPKDARKELGPDPRLSYLPFTDTDEGTIVLAPEGPIGLSFDREVAAAAAYPNTALLLTLRSLASAATGKSPALGPRQLDEHFLSVVLRRYLDHHWLVDEQHAIQAAPAEPTAAPFGQTWWIEFPLSDGQLVVAAPGLRPMAVARCVVEGRALVVTVDRFAVDETVDTRDQAGAGLSTPGHDTHALRLCRVPGLGAAAAAAGEAKGGSIAFLHTPVDPRRAVLSVFFVQDPQADTGPQDAGNAPLLLASLEWSVPKVFDAATLGIAGARHTLASVNASQSTALHWSRTSTNFDTVYAEPPTADGEPGPVGVRELSVSRSGATRLRFQCSRDAAPGAGWWVRALQSTKPFPVHAQRHIAILPSELRTGIGDPLDIPTAARMASAREVSLADGGARVERVRIIEFETPAIILGYSKKVATPVPEHYRQGYFDLTATGFDGIEPASAQQERHFSIYIRVISSGQALKALSSLRLDLRGVLSGADDWVSLLLERSPKTKAFAFVVDMVVTSAGMVKNFTSTSIDADGLAQVRTGNSLRKASNQTVLAGWPLLPVLPADESGIELRNQGMEARVGNATSTNGDEPDLWLEMSLLTSLKGSNGATCGFMDAVDFDWFFGSSAHSPESAVTVAAMSRMREAQGRIISVSQPVFLQSA